MHGAIRMAAAGSERLRPGTAVAGMPAGLFRHGMLRGILRRLAAWAVLRRQRRALARLDRRLLGDIGLSTDAAMTEARRPFWDAPRHWRC